MERNIGTMKQIGFKASALALAAALTLTGCGAAGAQDGGASVEGLRDYVTYELSANEMDKFFILNANTATNNQVLSNLYDGLLEVDPNGALVPCLAESWGSEDDGKTWTFTLREGATWVDINGEVQADVVAQDFITGLEWVLNYYKNGSTNTSMPIDLIEGAGDYYEYTKSLTEEEALALDNSKFLELVGIEAPDERTVVYTCTAPTPYFASVSAYVCLYPLSQALEDQIGAANLLSAGREDLWYNGAYLLTEFVQGNEKVFTPNPHYWDTECTRFDSVTVKMVESQDNAYLLYQSGEIDNVTLTESQLSTILSSEDNEYYDYVVETRPTKFSYSIHFNFDKHTEDGSTDDNWNTAVANTAFRKAWYYGLDLLPYLSRVNAVNPLHCENNAYSMKGLVSLSDGTDYVDLVLEKLDLPASDGETLARLDSSLAQQYKEQAIQELTALGVTFPVEADYYIAGGNQTALDSATVLKQAIEDSLGTDFVTVNIKEYISSQSAEVATPRLHSFTFGGWGADYGDPQNYLGQEVLGSDDAYYANTYSNANEVTDGELAEILQTFTQLVADADAVTGDLDERYDAYAEAEVYLIENAIVIPAYYDIQWELTHVNDYTKEYAMFGCQNFKYKNWETSATAYTTEQYQAFSAEAGK